MEKEMEETERYFSIELKSKADLKNISLTNGAQDSVLVEGTIGELVQATFEEGIILEIAGKRGTLRINLKEKELRKEPQDANTSENLKGGTVEQTDSEKETREVKLCK